MAHDRVRVRGPVVGCALASSLGLAATCFMRTVSLLVGGGCAWHLLEPLLPWISSLSCWVADMFGRLTSLATVALVLQTSAAQLSRCTQSTFSLPSNAVIERIAPVNNGGSFGEGAANIPYPTNPTNLPELCALIVKVTSSPRSSFRFGLFLPTNWTTRFLAVGNGGFAGGINWLEMAPGPHYGMASMSTDTGHNSSVIDMTWALNNLDTKIDWAWRAMAGSVDLAKTLTEAYYQKKISKSYYNGCSSGGRQGLKQIQLSPNTFDGVLVGAPAWYTSHINPSVVYYSMLNLPASGPNHMEFSQFGIVSNEVLRQCDSQDGVRDSIVSAPDTCRFDFGPITCGRPGVPANNCITAAQVNTTKGIWADWKARNGTFLSHGYSPSSEWNWLLFADANNDAPFGLAFVRYFLYDNPFFAPSEFNESVVTDAERHPANPSADKYDLSDYKSRGGKVILYHGMSDGIVPTKLSDLYYSRVSSAMGGANNLESFFRYFKLPGVQHCWGTALNVNAPWNIAGAGQAGAMGTGQWSVPGFRDAQHDALLALVDWVEQGKAVDSIIATNWQSQLDPNTPVLKQRPLCPYPKKQVYNGGNVNLPGSWSCR